MEVRFVALLVLLAGCAGDRPPGERPIPLGSASFNHLVVAATDFTSEGVLARLNLTKNDPAATFPIHKDAVVRTPAAFPYIFVVNRLGKDSILVLGRDLTVKGNYSVGEKSNPQDIAIIDENTAYVSRHERTSLLKLHPITGKNAKEIRLVAGEDPPEATWMHVSKDKKKLFVLLQQLTNFQPLADSQIATVDLATDQVTTVNLERRNPVTEIKEGPNGQLYVGETWLMSKLDGAIECVSEKRIVITEEKLLGDIVDFEMLGPNRGVAIVASPASRLVAFEDGKVIKTLAEGENYAYQQILWDRERERLYLADRDPRKPGVRVFNATTFAEEGARWNSELPPYHMGLME